MKVLFIDWSLESRFDATAHMAAALPPHRMRARIVERTRRKRIPQNGSFSNNLR
jgi:hypothetical protein